MTSWSPPAALSNGSCLPAQSGRLQVGSLVGRLLCGSPHALNVEGSSLQSQPGPPSARARGRGGWQRVTRGVSEGRYLLSSLNQVLSNVSLSRSASPQTNHSGLWVSGEILNLRRRGALSARVQGENPGSAEPQIGAPEAACPPRSSGQLTHTALPLLVSRRGSSSHADGTSPAVPLL